MQCFLALCLVHDNKYIPLDYKTRGSAPKEGASEKYYQTQLDTYALLLDSNGYPAHNLSYLIYYYPKEVKKNGVVEFTIEPVEVQVDPDRVKKVFEAAVTLLRGSLPKQHPNCEYCTWGRWLEEYA